MNRVQVKQHLQELVYDLLESVVNEELKEIIEEETFITGGCFKSLVLNEPVNDYDFYFFNTKSCARFQQLIKEGTNLGKPFTNVNKCKLTGYHATNNAISFNLSEENESGKIRKIQFITRWCGTPEAITQNFDFQHCMNFYLPHLKIFQLDEDKIRHKLLIFNKNASHPVNAMKRMIKFLGQGWSIEDEDVIEMAKTISTLNLKDEKVLKEQTVGMYLTNKYTSKLENNDLEF